MNTRVLYLTVPSITLLFFIRPSHLVQSSLFILFCDWVLTKVFCSNSLVQHQSGAPFINASVLPQGFDRKSYVTQAVSFSSSTFPPSSTGNAYLRKSTSMFHLALPTPTAMLMLETSTRQLNLRAATASPESFPSLNYITSNVPYQVLGAGRKPPVYPLWENMPQGKEVLAARGTFALRLLSPTENISKRKCNLQVSGVIMTKANKKS